MINTPGPGLISSLLIGSAAIDSINPCAFSVLALTIGFLVSLGRSRRSIIISGLVYIAGIFLLYFAFGMGLLGILKPLAGTHIVSRIGAGILILFGLLELINETFPKFPIRLKIPDSAHAGIAKLIEKGSLPALFVLGIFVALTELPCTGGPYVFALGLLHDHVAQSLVAVALVLYNLIFVAPLLAILFIASHPASLSKIDAWKKSNSKAARWIMGLGMIALGFLLFVLQ